MNIFTTLILNHTFFQNSHEFIDLFFEYGFNRRLNSEEILDIYKKVLASTDFNSLLSKLSGFENANHSDFSYNEISKLVVIGHKVFFLIQQFSI